ncbi:MAG: secondary thiamine-phosphate synthase enzyme YjbQ [Candidatus Thorarchaeota archaeon]|jgi:secondary thiamine-phosphate synthase enzyme
MAIYYKSITLSTNGNCDIIDVTGKVGEIVRESNLEAGICTVFCPGSTASITTIEYEGGLLKDFPEALDRLVPENITYEHHLRWGDGNGHSHVRASLMGPSLTIPFVNRSLTLGTWQQVVCCDFDNKPRNRKIEVMLISE